MLTSREAEKRRSKKKNSRKKRKAGKQKNQKGKTGKTTSSRKSEKNREQQETAGKAVKREAIPGKKSKTLSEQKHQFVLVTKWSASRFCSNLADAQRCASPPAPRRCSMDITGITGITVNACNASRCEVSSPKVGVSTLIKIPMRQHKKCDPIILIIVPRCVLDTKPQTTPAQCSDQETTMSKSAQLRQKGNGDHECDNVLSCFVPHIDWQFFLTL